MIHHDVIRKLDDQPFKPNTDLRLCRFFGLSSGYWLRAQAAHDTEVAEAAMGKMLRRIKPWPGRAE